MKKPIILELRKVIEFFPKAPFHFDATMHKPDHFPSADNTWEPGIRWQTMLWQGKPLGLKFANEGTIEQPKLSVLIWSKNTLESSFYKSLSDEITYRYNLQLDLSVFNREFIEPVG